LEVRFADKSLARKLGTHKDQVNKPCDIFPAGATNCEGIERDDSP
jgi:hypothetical protein